MAHSPPMPMPARKRNRPSCQTFWAKAAAPVKTENTRMVAARQRARPKRSAMGPHRKDSPQPIRNSANRIEPAKATLAGVAAMPEWATARASPAPAPGHRSPNPCHPGSSRTRMPRSPAPAGGSGASARRSCRSPLAACLFGDRLRHRRREWPNRCARAMAFPKIG